MEPSTFHKTISSQVQTHDKAISGDEHKTVLSRRKGQQMKSRRSHGWYICRWTPKSSPLGEGPGPQMIDKVWQDFAELAAQIEEGWKDIC